MTLNRRASAMLPSTNGKKTTTHTARKLYVWLAYEQFGRPHNVSFAAFANAVLGHDSASLQSAANYSTVKVDMTT